MIPLCALTHLSTDEELWMKPANASAHLSHHHEPSRLVRQSESAGRQVNSFCWKLRLYGTRAKLVLFYRDLPLDYFCAFERMWMIYFAESRIFANNNFTLNLTHSSVQYTEWLARGGTSLVSISLPVYKCAVVSQYKFIHLLFSTS